ncbi:uncharacterized protein LOC131242586 [Magnolia sinica]|uniref:uncharacterized protein LOC131242586 n=1 Tax=Magnolia sinica TaxID=86752 RepID=UPI00265819CB|nr:uncharacterized protein LOC131242586 [Magnolia sinica]
MRRVLTEAKSRKLQQRDWERDMREELRGTGWGLGAIDEHDDDDDEGIVYPDDCVTARERSDFRQVIRESRASEWEGEQRRRIDESRPSFGTSRHEAGGSSRRFEGGSRHGLQRTQSARVPDAPIAGVNQKRLKNMWSKGLREKVGGAISRWFISSHVPANAAASPHFKNMIEEVQRAGPGVKPPTPQEILGVYLDREHEEMQAWVRGLKPNWKQYGVTIMCDGWTGPTKLSIINFMVYCRGQPVFLKSIDASARIKDHEYIYALLKGVIRDVESQNVVQVVTDNGSAFVKAGRKLMRKFNIYWTPCAAHCIDLMLEEIGQRDSVRKTIQDARKVTNFIYNHSWLLAAMRECCGGDIVRPGATRFATNFIALDSLYRHRVGLRNLFRSERYMEWNQKKTEGAKICSNIVLSDAFWDKVHNVVSFLHPMYKVLRAVDNEMWPSMGSMYELMRIMRQGIMTAIPTSYQWVIDIIDRRWTGTLEHPLHQAAYYLNPKFHYKRRLHENQDLTMVVHEAFGRLFPESTAQADFGNQVMQ